jgi:hypothetical protein
MTIVLALLQSLHVLGTKFPHSLTHTTVEEEEGVVVPKTTLPFHAMAHP